MAGQQPRGRGAGRAPASVATLPAAMINSLRCPIDAEQVAIERVGVDVTGAPDGVLDLVREPLTANAGHAPTN